MITTLISTSMHAQFRCKLILQDSIFDKGLEPVQPAENGYNVFKNKNEGTYILSPQYGFYSLECPDLKLINSFIKEEVKLDLDIPEYMYIEREKINPLTFVANLPNYLSRLKSKLNIQKSDFGFDLGTVKIVSEALFPIPDNDEELIFLLSVFADEVYRKETNSIWKFDKIFTLNPFYIPTVFNKKSNIRGVGINPNSTDLLYQVNNAISMTKTGQILIPDFEKIIEANKKRNQNEEN